MCLNTCNACQSYCTLNDALRNLFCLNRYGCQNAVTYPARRCCPNNTWTNDCCYQNVATYPVRRCCHHTGWTNCCCQQNTLWTNGCGCYQTIQNTQTTQTDYDAYYARQYGLCGHHRRGCTYCGVTGIAD